MRTDRKEDLDRYYNDHLKMRIISRLIKINSWNAIMGIQSDVMEAELTQEKAEYAEQQEFKKWKEKRKK